MSLLTSAAPSRTNMFRPLDVAEVSAEPTFPTDKPWADVRRPVAAVRDRLDLAIVDARPLISDCFGRGLSAVDPMIEIHHFADIDELEHTAAEDLSHINLILMCISWTPGQAKGYFAQIERLRSSMPDIDIILLSDIPEIADILKAIEAGARGYIPTTVSLEVAVKAMHLVVAGGVYVPASVLFWSDRVGREGAQQTKADPAERTFTSRQISVIEALRRGKANKTIAYELNMCESTVKVHVRNIMKRLKAKNRTEVAYILNSMMSQRDDNVRHYV